MEQGYFSNPEASQDVLTQIIGRMKPEGIQTIFGVIAEEAEEFRLDSEKRKTLAREYGMSGKEVSSWQTAANILNLLVQHQAKANAECAAEYDRRDLSEDGKKVLALVTKDDLLFMLAKKLTDARNKENAGSLEEALRLVRWEEGKFEHRYRTDTIGEKVLLIGNSKSAGNAIKVMDVRFEKYGVKYGWIGSCAFISADLRKIRAKGHIRGVSGGTVGSVRPGGDQGG